MTHWKSTLALAIGALSAACSPTKDAVANYPTTPNYFVEYLGKSEAEVDAKIERDFQSLFYGDDKNERLYYPVGDDMAYIWDVANNDVRTEGMSYGMMIAVQMDKKEEFDRLWKWTCEYMRHNSGDLEGYFAWHCSTDGKKLSIGSASDGEEWFAMALFFAGKRWGDGEGIFNYTSQANAVLHAMLHKEGVETPRLISIFDKEYHQVRFVPWVDWDGISDPSYHLPAFYELWTRWADADNEFWAQCAVTSRAFLKEVAHPETGLMPDYANYKPNDRDYGGHKDFRFDAWRVMSNVALDHAWWGKDAEWQRMQSNRILTFLQGFYPRVPNQFTVDGKPLSQDPSSGLFAMAATAALAADRDIAKPFVEHFWNAPPPTGQWRYYDGVLHMLALLQVSGKFEIIDN